MNRILGTLLITLSAGCLEVSSDPHLPGGSLPLETSLRLPFLSDADVNAAVNAMIHENIIRHEVGMYLKLIGE